MRGLPDVFRKQTRALCGWTKENKRNQQEMSGSGEKTENVTSSERGIGGAWGFAEDGIETSVEVCLEYLLNS